MLFITKWIKGKDNDAAGALSRYPCSSPKPGEDIAEYDIDICHSVHTIKCLTTSEIRLLNDPGDNLRLRELRDHAKRDQEYQSLLTLVTQGFPNQKCDLPSDMKKFWGIREHLGYEDDLLVYGCRLFIPVTFRSTVPSLLHEAHQGITRSQDRARLTLYWPGIDADIQQTVEGCKLCQDHLPSHPREPIISKPRPQWPFQEVAMDFAYFAGHNFLITVDCCTDWPEIIQMGKDMTAKKTIEATRNLFCRTAAPDVLWSDGGPQFTSEKFQSFLRDWDVTHKMSTPRYPQSNGKIEATVKSMKKLITAAWTGRSVNQDKLFRALLQYRNTPSRRDGQSPAQKLYGHPIQDTLPAHRRSFAPEWQRHSLDTEESLKISEEYYDQQLTSFQIYTLAPMLPSRTPLLSYGTFTGSSQPSHPIGDTSFALNLETSSSVTGDSFVSALPPQFMHRDPSTSFLRIQYLTHFRPLRDQPVNADCQNVSSRMNTGTNLDVVTYVHAQLTYVYAQHLEGEM